MNIKDNLPLISALLLVLGTLRLIFFYSYFGIDITSYIDLSEIFSLSLSFFAKSAVIIIAIMLFYAPWNLNTDQHGGFTITDVSVRAVTNLTAIISAILSLYLLGAGYLDFTVTWDLGWVMIIMLGIPFASRYIVPKLTNSVNTGFHLNLSPSFFAFILLMLSVSTSVIIYVRNEARNILYQQAFTKAEAKIDTITIAANTNYRYIGKTKNFIFFYNKSTSKADAFSLSDVKHITVSDNHRFDGILINPADTVRRKEGK